MKRFFSYYFLKKRKTKKEEPLLLESEEEKNCNYPKKKNSFILFRWKFILLGVIIFSILSYFYIAKFDFWSGIDNTTIENAKDMIHLHETAILNYANMLTFYIIVIITAIIIIRLLLSSIRLFMGKNEKEEITATPFKIDKKKGFYIILYIFMVIAYVTKNQRLSWDNFSKYFLENHSIIIVVSILLLYVLISFFVFLFFSAFYSLRSKIIQKSKDLIERVLKICKNTIGNIISLIEFLSTDFFASIVFLLKEPPDTEEEITNTAEEENN